MWDVIGVTGQWLVTWIENSWLICNDPFAYESDQGFTTKLPICKHRLNKTAHVKHAFYKTAHRHTKLPILKHFFANLPILDMHCTKLPISFCGHVATSLIPSLRACDKRKTYQRVRNRLGYQWKSNHIRQKRLFVLAGIQFVFTRYNSNAKRSYFAIYHMIVAPNSFLCVLWPHVPRTSIIPWFSLVLLTHEFFIYVLLSKHQLYRTHIMSFDFWHFIPAYSCESGQEHSEYISNVHRSHREAKIRNKKLKSSPTWTEHGVIGLCELMFLHHHNLMYTCSYKMIL